MSAVPSETPSGSSPHTRGARPPGRSRPTRRGDHPRIRGEHPSECDEGHIVTGSSPHTRGALGLSVPPTAVLRIIPAYAGSTPFSLSPLLYLQDHPRIRGEHRVRRRRFRSGKGSSPHTRGARAWEGPRRSGGRIIPAYAGSTRDGASWTVRRKDHPRIRGEHSVLAGGHPPYEGSSPHTRGARPAEARHC